MHQEDTYIVIPAKDEALTIGLMIHKIKKEGFQNIIVVNDGSTDDTATIAEKAGALVLSHPVNLGPGAATQTGMTYAMMKQAKIVVTIDGDNQHYPTDIWQMITALKEEKVDLVIGSRFLKKNKSVPIHRWWMNKIGNMITALFTGLWVTDSQSGLKAIRGSFVDKINIQLNGFEFCTEIIGLIRQHNATFSEIPIQVRYTQASMQKGQTFANGIQMVFTFIRHYF